MLRVKAALEQIKTRITMQQNEFLKNVTTTQVDYTRNKYVEIMHQILPLYETAAKTLSMDLRNQMVENTREAVNLKIEIEKTRNYLVKQRRLLKSYEALLQSYSKLDSPEKHEEKRQTEPLYVADQERYFKDASQTILSDIFHKVQQLNATSGDIITKIEAKVARLEFDIEEHENKINQVIDTLELSDIVDKFNDSKSIGTKIRENAQIKRMPIEEKYTEYYRLTEKFKHLWTVGDMDEVESLKKKAKEILKLMEGNKVFLDKELDQINFQLKIFANKKELLELYLKPLDEATRSNMKRIKENIHKKFTDEQLKELSIYFYYDVNYGRFYLYVHKVEDIKTITLSKSLAYMLGFEIDNIGRMKNIRLLKGGGYAKYSPDIRSGIHQLYVYMPSIIEPTYLGDSLYPLLRIINVEKGPGEIAENIYTHEYHHKIIEKRINKIHIDIKTSSNELVRFDWGDVIITLHFKRSLF